MFRFLFGLMIGVTIGVGCYMYWKRPMTQFKVGVAERRATARVEAAGGKISDSVQEAVQSIDTDGIKQQLAQTGQTVANKAQQAGNAIVYATDDMRTTATVKSQLAVHPHLSALNISVSTTAGVVTLSGKVATQQNVKEAMQVALNVEGVREVVAALQVGP